MRDQVSKSDENIETLQRELSAKVAALLKEKAPNHDKIYAEIVERVGESNLDGYMLSFAIKKSLKDIAKEKLKIKDSGKQLEVKKQVDLIVSWALMKIKAKNDAEIERISSNQSKNAGFGAGVKIEPLKKFKVKDNNL